MASESSQAQGRNNEAQAGKDYKPKQGGPEVDVTSVASSEPQRERKEQRWGTGFDVSSVSQEPREDWTASDYPVNNMSAEEQEKLRKKGINPALKAEMDAKAYGKENEKKISWWQRAKVQFSGTGWV